MEIKAKQLIALSLSMLLSGCASTVTNSSGKEISEPESFELYSGIVGYCDFSYNYITKHSGVDPAKSPETRKIEKDKTWSNWKAQGEKFKQNLQGRQFYISHPAGFTRFDKETGLMKLYELGYTNSSGPQSPDRFHHRSAIPNSVIFNTFEGDITSLKMPAGWYRDFYPNLSMSQIFNHKAAITMQELGSPQHRKKHNYVINHANTGLSTWRNGSYGGVELRNYQNRKLLSIELDTKKWFENEQSPIFNKNGEFYLDTRKVNFYETFGIYPDIGTPYIEINYIFEISGCQNGQLYGDVKEVKLTNLKGDKLIRHIIL